MNLINKGINNLYYFLFGYCCCETDNYINNEIDIFDIFNDGGFDLCVHKYYGINTTYGWSQIIIFYNLIYREGLNVFLNYF